MKVTILILILFALLPFGAADSPFEQITAPNLFTDLTATYLPTTSQWTNRAEVADLNGDGLLDIVFANGGNYSEAGPAEQSRVFINQGANAKFKEVTSQIFGTETYYARVVKILDIDNDGIPDMLIGTTFQTQSQLYKGLGKGEFRNVTASQLPQIKASVGDLELGDVDDDGDLDIALVDWGAGNNMTNAGGRTMLWLNDGQGKFSDVTPKQMPDLLVQFSWDLEFIDYDNDFDLDLAISCKRCATSRLFENDGKGVFTNKNVIPAYTNNYEFEVMDLNKDGFLDLVTVNDGEIVGRRRDSRREHIFLNNNGKGFVDATDDSWPPSENIGEDDNNVVFLDYDSDGDPDFLLSSLTGEDRLLINDGKGKFKLAQPVLNGNPTPHTLSIVLGDINNDNKLDIIMAQGEGKTDLDERIFLGDKISPDTAPPIISHHRVFKNSDGTITIKARIHDNKSPNMPQDWKAVEMVLKRNGLPVTPVAMRWYGENLWTAKLNSVTGNVSICATDYCGNKSCEAVEW